MSSWYMTISGRNIRFETDNYDFRLCFDMMFALCEDHGITQVDDQYGVCFRTWPGVLSYDEFAVEYADVNNFGEVTRETQGVGSLTIHDMFMFDIADALAGANSSP